MKYDITHSCGHVATAELFGKNADREYRITRLEKELCADCAAAKLDAKNRETARQNAQDGLVALTGSEKQILWAESIRAEKIKAFEDKMRGTIEAFEREIAASDDEALNEIKRAIIAAIETTIATYRAESSAKVWIDGRGTTGADDATKQQRAIALGFKDKMAAAKG